MLLSKKTAASMLAPVKRGRRGSWLFYRLSALAMIQLFGLLERISFLKQINKRPIPTTISLPISWA